MDYAVQASKLPTHILASRYDTAFAVQGQGVLGGGLVGNDGRVMVPGDTQRDSSGGIAAPKPFLHFPIFLRGPKMCAL